MTILDISGSNTVTATLDPVPSSNPMSVLTNRILNHHQGYPDTSCLLNRKCKSGLNVTPWIPAHS